MPGSLLLFVQQNTLTSLGVYTWIYKEEQLRILHIIHGLFKRVFKPTTIYQYSVICLSCIYRQSEEVRTELPDPHKQEDPRPQSDTYPPGDTDIKEGQRPELSQDKSQLSSSVIIDVPKEQSCLELSTISGRCTVWPHF